MPPALDRLLASPSALRLLRSIVTGPELPACHTTAECRAARSIAARQRTYAKSHGPPKKSGWKRWSEQSAVVAEREDVVKTLLNPAPAKTACKRSRPAAGFDFLNDILGGAEEHMLGDEGFAEDPHETWATRLAHHERLDGLQGIWDVWHARRREGYRLPTENSAHAQYLWRTFARHPKLVHFVIEHAAELQQDQGETYPRVYSVIMEHWLVRKPTEALEYHRLMLAKLGLRKLPLRELAQHVQNYGHTAQEALLYIYRTSNERDVYNEVVPRLISAGNIGMARRWHNLCTFRGDHPSESYAAMPVVQVFIAEAAALADPNIRFDKTRRQNPSLNKHLMRRLLGRDTAPVRFEDSFTARMFATRTVQIDSIIKGLTMVGVNEIGPLAVSAMAWRTQPITDLPRRFEDLRAAGIALQGSVFSLALEKFASEQRWDLVQSILESDQHPDVYSDVDTQRSLLTYYLEQKDLMQAQRTLAILSLFHNDASRESWNLLLQLRIRVSRPQDVFNTMLEMRSLGTTLSGTTMASVRSLLARRQRGHRPSFRRGFDDLRFVTRFYITALEAGMARIPPEAWHEIIRRFGMQGRFRELKRLLLWLLSWYAPRNSTEFADLPRSSYFDAATTALRRQYPINRHYYNFPANVAQKSSKSHPIRLLFPPSLQQGILIWGFRSSLLRTAPLEQSLLSATAAKRHHRPSLLRKNILSRLHWSVGLRLLVQLRALGVHIHPHTVAKTLQAQFINLFGYGHSRIKANRRMERANTVPYKDYVREVNKLWGERLFTEPQMLGKGRLDGVLWHPRFRRRGDRGRDVSLRWAMGGEWAGGQGSSEEKSRPEKESEAQTSGAFDELERAPAAHAHAKGRE
ncbi:pentatricopeptide repeat domain-containing protein [Stagonosporopsis vannaccii]|nr:pentatricopeptide repeat domain-containing protein [Stagonosporopsis vannaccii]